MDPWQRQRALARLTAVWAAVSITAGAVLARRPPESQSDRWWRAFGQQHVGWGAVDLAIIVVANALQARRMRRAGDPYAPETLEAERRTLHLVLGVNAAADAGYALGGFALWRGGRRHPRASGAGAAILLQSLFLLAHDGYHAVGSRPAQATSAMAR